MSEPTSLTSNEQTFCQEPRHGIYGGNAVCGDYATHLANGSPVCQVHANRSRQEGKTVVLRDPMKLTGGDGTYQCPWCGYSSPHEHFIDRKGYVRGFSGEVLGRVSQDTRPRNAFGELIVDGGRIYD